MTKWRSHSQRTRKSTLAFRTPSAQSREKQIWKHGGNWNTNLTYVQWALCRRHGQTCTVIIKRCLLCESKKKQSRCVMTAIASSICSRGSLRPASGQLPVNWVCVCLPVVTIEQVARQRSAQKITSTLVEIIAWTTCSSQPMDILTSLENFAQHGSFFVVSILALALWLHNASTHI